MWVLEPLLRVDGSDQGPEWTASPPPLTGVPAPALCSVSPVWPGQADLPHGALVSRRLTPSCSFFSGERHNVELLIPASARAP